MFVKGAVAIVQAEEFFGSVAGPVISPAISGIDQALWDLRGKALEMPVYKLLGGPFDPRGVRGYYHVDGAGREQLTQIRETAREEGITCVKSGIPGYYEWLERRPKIDRAIKAIQLLRETAGPDNDIVIDFHAKTSPSVASTIIKEVEPLNLLFVEEPCPPENVQAMARLRGVRPPPSLLASDWLRRMVAVSSSKWEHRHSSDRYQSCRRHHRVVEGGGNGQCFFDLDGTACL